MSSTSDTAHLSEGSSPSGCPCGRDHSDLKPRKRRPPRALEDSAKLTEEIYDGVVRGSALQTDTGVWFLSYAGDCLSPLSIAASSGPPAYLLGRRQIRCRKCSKCLAARTRYWVYRASKLTNERRDAGLRTWFGTLTFTPEWQDELLTRARLSHASPNGAWWDDEHCDYRFALVRDEVVHEVQKFWKRMRKAKCRFDYFVVIERHKSGLPHLHFLLHEKETIRKREIKAAWELGFVQCNLVKQSAKAAFYCAKYLSKSFQSRQMASIKYGKS